MVGGSAIKFAILTNKGEHLWMFAIVQERSPCERIEPITIRT